MAPSPSASLNVLEAVSVSPCLAVPVTVTPPAGASLTLDTGAVAPLVTLVALSALSV